MAKKKRTRKTTKRKTKRGGMRGLRSGNIGNKVGLLLSNVLAANLAHEGVELLSGMDFMQQSVDSTSKYNFKQIGLAGGLTILGGVAAVMVKNDYANSIGAGIASGASIHVKDRLVKPAMGMGAVEDFLELYKTDEPLKDLGELELSGPGESGNRVELV